MSIDGRGPGEDEIQSSGGRPTEEDLVKKIENYMFQKQGVPHRYRETVDEIRDMMNGQGNPEIQEMQEQFYPGWTSDDFREVLKRLGEL